MTKHTLNGTRRKVLKSSGFRSRMLTSSGKKILKRRLKRGRWKLVTIHKFSKMLY